MDSVRLTDTRLWSDLVLVSRDSPCMSLSRLQFRLVTLNRFGGKSLWEGNLIVQVVAGSTPVAIAGSRIRLLARSAVSQAAGRRSKLLCGTLLAN